MTAAEDDRAICDPIGLITDLVAAVEPGLDTAAIRVVVGEVCGGRAKSRRLAGALATRPGVLLDGRSPAPRAVGELLLALRKAGAAAVGPPCCADCGKKLRTLQRRGQHWYCAVCGQTPAAACAGCGNITQVAMRDRDGRPRCAQCPVRDDRDPVSVIHAVVAGLDPAVGRDAVADAVAGCCRRPAYQRRLAWALETDPALLTGQGHRAALRVIPRLVEHLHAAGIAGIVLPTCPGCHRMVRIDKPLAGHRVCRTCIAHSRLEECARCRAYREPVTRDEHGRPVCANCYITDPANLQTCLGCGRRRRVGRRTVDGPLCPSCPALPVDTCSICDATTPCGISRTTGRPWCPACQQRTGTCSGCGRNEAITAGTLTRPLCADCTPPAAWLGAPSAAIRTTPGRDDANDA